ncbi:NUDIX hydrolase [Acidithiobacillus sp. AMEEHan]|uniref:NUDIX hydrolase n=1 Tax=Acidithiobacillus sp. AMEEHan TaxID=2994951 RepID=UPI0027E41959|nr:NUDIX hydrolase [Acidithiobacillus sp. AMEEHan]
MRWSPHVTVAAVTCDTSGRFLLVEELIDGVPCLNQPAGHWERGESLIEAVIRETREETGYDFVPEAILGIYHWQHPHKDLTYLRIAFAGHTNGHDPLAPLDTGILGPRWLRREELPAARLRTVMVEQCIQDFLAGQRCSLDLLHSL